MARVTVEDCIDKVDNRFELVLLASHRARLISSGAPLTVARDRVREMMDQKRLSLEDGAKERFANLERVLNEAASYLPDVSALRAEVEAARAKYDRQSEELRRIRERRLLRAEHALRNNPTAASRRHRGPFEQLKRIQQRDEEEKKAYSGTRLPDGHNVES